MKVLRLIPFLFLFFGSFPYQNLVYAENENPNNYKILSKSNKTLSISNVQFYIKEGDNFIAFNSSDSPTVMGGRNEDPYESSLNIIKAYSEQTV